jgi:hypothetical protein
MEAGCLTAAALGLRLRIPLTGELSVPEIPSQAKSARVPRIRKNRQSLRILAVPCGGETADLGTARKKSDAGGGISCNETGAAVVY